MIFSENRFPLFGIMLQYRRFEVPTMGCTGLVAELQLENGTRKHAGRACHHGDAIVSRPDHNAPDYGQARDARLAARRGQKQMCKTSRQSGDECIAAAPDLWFEGLGFPHPVKPAKDPIRGANLIGSRMRQGCRGGAGLAPETAVVTKTRLHACPGKVGPVFR
jgi:hypothetical protein